MARCEPTKVVPNLVPLIDIISQLVIFFLLAAHFVSAEVDAEVQLPELTHSVAGPLSGEQSKLVLNLKCDTGMDRALGDVGISVTSVMSVARDEGRSWMACLKDAITKEKARVAERGGSLVVVLRADRRLAWQAIQDVMQVVSQAGVPDVRLGAPMSND